MVSAGSSIAPYASRTSVHNLDILFNHPLKFQVTQCICNEDMKRSVDLRDIPSLDSTELKVRSDIARMLASDAPSDAPR